MFRLNHKNTDPLDILYSTILRHFIESLGHCIIERSIVSETISWEERKETMDRKEITANGRAFFYNSW